MFFFSCGKSSLQPSVVSQPREQVAALITDSVVSLVSDSGITRYRLEAPKWLMYDRTEPPYQEFPDGIYLEQFDSPELKWNEQTHRVFSDTTIHITREHSIIEGVGFDSNEEMTKYTILNPTGVFPIEEE